MKIDYEKKMQNIIETIKMDQGKKKLLIHSCCAPCSCAILEFLNEYFEITIFFYNPNITDPNEYQKRIQEQLEYLTKNSLQSIKLLEGPYNPQADFFSLVKGLESSPEGGDRCSICYEKRLEETAKKAKELGFDYFSTVLSISPLKNSQKINLIGANLESKYSIKFLYADFKKKERYKRSVELSKTHQLYRQDYCGCPFSFKKPTHSLVEDGKDLGDYLPEDVIFEDTLQKCVPPQYMTLVGMPSQVSTQNHGLDNQLIDDSLTVDNPLIDDNLSIDNPPVNDSHQTALHGALSKENNCLGDNLPKESLVFKKKNSLALIISVLLHIAIFVPVANGLLVKGDMSKDTRDNTISVQLFNEDSNLGETKGFSEKQVGQEQKEKSEDMAGDIENNSEPITLSQAGTKPVEKEKEKEKEKVTNDKKSDKKNDKKDDVTQKYQASREDSFEIGGDGERILRNQNIKGIEYKILNAKNPSYPSQAKKFNVGTVTVKIRFLIGKDGTVEKIEFLEGRKDLGFKQEIEKNVSQWKFTPIKYKGELIKLYFYQEFVFRID